MSNTEDKKFCIICGTKLQFWIRKKERDIFRCPQCDHICIPDGVIRDDKHCTIYEKENPIFENSEKIDYYLDETNFFSAKNKRDLVSKYVPNGINLLDVGSNYGHFLYSIKDIFCGEGLEISKKAVQWGKINLNIASSVGSAESFPESIQHEFDAITMWDVIEHLECPIKAIDEAYRHLKSNGFFFISTPDSSSLLAKVLGKKWHHISPEQHIHLLSRENLKGLLEKSGFGIVDIQDIGHFYRLSYIVNKIFKKYKSQHTQQKRGLFIRLGKLKVFLKLHDVMLIIAQKKTVSLPKRLNG